MNKEPIHSHQRKGRPEVTQLAGPERHQPLKPCSGGETVSADTPHSGGRGQRLPMRTTVSEVNRVCTSRAPKIPAFYLSENVCDRHAGVPRGPADPRLGAELLQDFGG